MFDHVREIYARELASIEEAGLRKRERVIESPQGARIRVNGKEVLNFCANNYLGLSNSEVLKTAAKNGIDQYGLGLSSVRFICGTQTIHKALERKIAEFLGTEDSILYTSCFDANGGLFETLLGEQDAIVSDSLNHASIIDGIRLCKAKRFRYEHNNLKELEAHLKTAKTEGCPRIMVATDSVFSMDGDVADLPAICDIAERYGAMMMVDESHATGFFGPTGRGVIEHWGVTKRIDLITSTLGKALGGSAGGFTTGKAELIDLLRQRSRPYLFSNSLPPALVSACLACLEMLQNDTSLRDKLAANTSYFRERMSSSGFNIRPGIHPIVPIMLGEAKLATALAEAMLDEGIYVVGFSFPVVPKGQARIRVQISAAHSREDLDLALSAFAKAGRKVGAIRSA